MTKATSIRVSFLLLVSLLTLVLADSSSAYSRQRRESRKSPHVEITATARVENVPQRKVHRNRREFEEFDITIESAAKAPEGDRDGDSSVVIDMRRRVHVVHDLSCGGSWVNLSTGDRIELKGEYVHPTGQGDLIHFTHPADGSCGRAGGHPGGFLRKAGN